MDEARTEMAFLLTQPGQSLVMSKANCKGSEDCGPPCTRKVEEIHSVIGLCLTVFFRV